jgi:hypothetical protein
MWANDPWGNVTYCWVVICKNAKAHRQTNVLIGHKIPLAETDAFESLPVSGPLKSSAMSAAMNLHTHLRKL